MSLTLALRDPARASRARRALPLALSLAAALQGCSRHAPPPAVDSDLDAPRLDVPADMVGVWTSTRGPVMRCIELHADGTYAMAPNLQAGDGRSYRGTWRVAQQQVTWRDSSQGFAPDVNRMVDVSPGHFTAIEADQSTTQFDRIAGPGATCPAQ